MCSEQQSQADVPRALPVTLFTVFSILFVRNGAGADR